MNETKAVKTMLQMYGVTSSPVSQGFYQALCLEAVRVIEKLENALVEAVLKNDDS